jgi:1-pyrroline-5-carboxylate dehydrogenase
MAFKLTYSTMHNPPQVLHDNFDKALEELKANFGRELPMYINGEARYSAEKLQADSPINTSWHLATFQKGTAKDADDAVAAAKAAFPAWSATPWQDRVAMVRKFAQRIEERVYEISAAVALEVGKNRLEALGEIQEAADLMFYGAKIMEENNGFIIDMENDPLVGFLSTNRSVLKPYGVWLVISPFNFPVALAAGPVGNALVAGNTVVLKPASGVSWGDTLMVECALEAGIPAGVLNLVTGPGSTVGNALTDNPDIAGITFTGSMEVGIGIYSKFANRSYPHPVILEMGGKNATIVSKNADLEDAAIGTLRSAFGLQGQKCSATSRILVEEALYQPFVDKLVELTKKLAIGDPTLQENWFGPVINKKAHEDYAKFSADLEKSGKILTGGKRLPENDLDKGYFCAPTIAVDVPLDHPLWKTEMFLPIVMIAPVRNLEEGMQIANDIDYGLTAGFYGNDQETEWFFENIDAGTTYANRPQGSTTGAWPGYQPFGGWKGSGSAGKNGGGLYYLPLYMREQSQTRVKRL